MTQKSLTLWTNIPLYSLVYIKPIYVDAVKPALARSTLASNDTLFIYVNKLSAAGFSDAKWISMIVKQFNPIIAYLSHIQKMMVKILFFLGCDGFDEFCINVEVVVFAEFA